MANLTLTIQDDVLKRARVRALQENTSINALVRSSLEAYAGINTERENAIKALLDLAQATSSGRGDNQWRRDELYDR